MINIGQFLVRRAERAPDQEGLVFGSTRLSERVLKRVLRDTHGHKES